jgi:hypothetical protein
MDQIASASPTNEAVPPAWASATVRQAMFKALDERQVSEELVTQLKDLIALAEPFMLAFPQLGSPVTAPGKALSRVFERWNIADIQAAPILGISDAGVPAYRQSTGWCLATRDMRDRATMVLDIYEGVYTLLKDPQAERTWIRTPRPDLENRSVLDLMTEGSQRNLIRAQAYVDHVNGR